MTEISSSSDQENQPTDLRQGRDGQDVNDAFHHQSPSISGVAASAHVAVVRATQMPHHGDVESHPPVEQTEGQSNHLNLQETRSSVEPPFSIWSRRQRMLLVWLCSFAGFISPMSTTIYYPALNTMARDLHKTPALINLSITMYMIFQALAPTIVGSSSDTLGRRPLFIICMAIYCVTNIGLALQSNYAALMVLRSVQACGSSGTIALAMAVIADLATPAERGTFMAIGGLGTTVGTSLGPIIGGLLDYFLGWKWIFWFLAIIGATFFFAFLLFIPETCRAVVGNGAIPPQPWNVTLLAYLHGRRHGNEIDRTTLSNKKQKINLLSSIPIIFEKEAGIVLLSLGVLYMGLMAIMASLPTELAKTYNFNSIEIGLCYLPLGIGSILTRQSIGRIIDWNFARLATKLNIPAHQRNKLTRLENFPIEHARLQIGIPLVYVCAAVVIAYGWVMQVFDDTGHRQPTRTVAGPIVLLLFASFAISGFFICVNALLVDSHPQSPAAATAANNLVRCLLGAGGVAFTVPLINAIGRGWTSTLYALIWVAIVSGIVLVMREGPRWRRETAEIIKMKKEKGSRTVDVETLDINSSTHCWCRS